MMKRNILDRKRILRELDHLTRPPRLEGKVKNAMMNPVRKLKRSAGNQEVRAPKDSSVDPD